MTVANHPSRRRPHPAARARAVVAGASVLGTLGLVGLMGLRAAGTGEMVALASDTSSVVAGDDTATSADPTSEETTSTDVSGSTAVASTPAAQADTSSHGS